VGFCDTKQKFNYTVFSKARKTTESIKRELFGITSYEVLKSRVVRMITQNNTGVLAHFKNDGNAIYSHRTLLKNEQIVSKNTKKSFVFGYKLHTIVNVETELPSEIYIAQANRSNEIFSYKSYDAIKKLYRAHLNPNLSILQTPHSIRQTSTKNCTMIE